ncbi:MAG: prepilin peptidase [Phycisphaerales bacterium]|nr:prepilin peptidase [Phycisphaerales bacterium]
MNDFLERLIPFLPHLVPGFFVFAAGACVGSFINLIAWRLPRGQGITRPESRCGACGRSLEWFENIPVLSCLFLRGRCRTCRSSFGYEHVLVELAMGALFCATYLFLYAGPWRFPAAEQSWWWTRNGPIATLPAMLAILICWSTLAIVSLIDARTFYVPIRMTAAATIAAFVLWRMQALVPSFAQNFALGHWGLDIIPAPLCVASVAAMVGLLVSSVLLWRGVIPRSFIDYEQEFIPARVIRMEMLKECIFLAPILGAFAIGCWLGNIPMIQEHCEAATFGVYGMCAFGFLVGGGIIWFTRILASIAFGREAMGLGDVHILGAAGAALGWKIATITFFMAPFIALSWLAISGGLNRILGKKYREIPYGPYLASACVISYLGNPWIEPFLRALLAPNAQ